MQETAPNQLPRLRFGPFEIDRVQRRLYKRGVPLRIESHPILVLLALLERPDEIVEREELQRRIWGNDTNVGFEDGLNTAVRKLRFALGDSAESPLFVETVPKKGYRFVAPVTAGQSDTAVSSKEVVRPDSDQSNRSDEKIHVVGENDAGIDLPQITAADPLPVNSKNRFRNFAPLGLIVLLALGAVGIIVCRHLRAERLASDFSPIHARKLDGVHTRESVAISPDGRYIAYERWDGEMSSIRLRQVENAGDVEILAPRKTNYVGLTFSPDGSELYFVGNSDNRSLFRMPALGGPTQKLIDEIDSPVSFSPDGRRFVFARLRADTASLELWMANADGAGEELFERFPDYAWGCFLPRAAWSPDGRTIVVPFHGSLTPAKSSLYAIDVATRKPEEVYSASGCIGQPAWTPQRSVIFSHQNELTTVLMEEKNRISGIRRLSGYGGKLGEQLDLSRDGKTGVAAADQSSMGLWTVPQTDSPARQLISSEASLSSVDELVNGRFLVTKEDSTIWTTKADGTDWRRLANGSGYAMVCGQFVVVQEDDRSLVRFREDGTGARTLVRNAVKTPTCSLKGDAVFYVPFDQPQQIMRVPIDGGNPTNVAKVNEGVLTTLKVSANGDFLAYTFYAGAPRNHLAVQILRTSDGALTDTIPEAKLGAWTFCWAPDGQGFDYVSAGDDWTEVWEQPISGGEAKRLTHFGAGEVKDFHWSRDGKRILAVWGRTSDDVILLGGA